MPSDTTLVIRATRIALEAHAGQFRSDGRTPFHWHPIRVAQLVSEDVKIFGRTLLGDRPAHEVVSAALVHDVLEDVPPKARAYWDTRIVEDLGSSVAAMARLLRNPSKDLPVQTARATKKDRDCQHYRDPGVPAAVRLIKLCDRADNLADMTGWSRSKVTTYLDESVRLVDALWVGLLESSDCRAYGEPATRNAFESPFARCHRSIAAAATRAE